MKKYRKLILPVILLLAMLACNMGQAWHDATVDETSTPTITPTATLTPTPVATNTPPPTSTPEGPAPAMISWLEAQGLVKDTSNYHVPCQSPCYPYWDSRIGVEIVVYPRGSTNIYMSLEPKYIGLDKSVVDNFITKFFGTNVYNSTVGLLNVVAAGKIYGIAVTADNVDGYNIEVEVMQGRTWIAISIYPA